MHATQSPSFLSKIWKPALATTIVGALLLLIAAGATVWGDLGNSGPTLVYYKIATADLPIVVTERGNLESQQQTTIRCQVENISYSRNSGSNGTTILFIVPNGSQVEEGDLLIELDSAAIRDALDAETLEWQSDQSQLLQAQARFKNQQTQNATRMAQAKLAQKLTELNLEMYADEETGTFKLEYEAIERQIDDTRNTMLEAQASLKLQETEKAGIAELFKLGYKGKSDLDQSRLSFQKAEAALAASVNRLTNHEATRRQLEDYQRKMEILRLEGEVNTAFRDLEQVKVLNESELAQVEAQVFEAREREKRERTRVEQFKRQLTYCNILAPHAGMAVYAQPNRRYGNDSQIAEGAQVRQRQELLTLPDLTRMQIRTQIHEAVLDQVRPGLPVTVRVDAVPNRTYDGIVSEVAVVPANNYNSSVKTYDCTIQILEDVEQLRPGMTAVCEIHVERLRDILAAPVQAVVQIDKQTWCYVDVDGSIERRDIVLGRSNDKFVHLRSGINEGDRIVLNPMAILSEQESEQTVIGPEQGAGEAPTIDADAISRFENQENEKASNAAGRRRQKQMRGKSGQKGGRRQWKNRQRGKNGSVPEKKKSAAAAI